jgi:hypothetical protein
MSKIVQKPAVGMSGLSRIGIRIGIGALDVGGTSKASASRAREARTEELAEA